MHSIAASISAGQFSNERAVEVVSHDGTKHSLFAQVGYIEGNRLFVSVVGVKGDLTLIRLPSETLEQGQKYLTVKTCHVADHR